MAWIAIALALTLAASAVLLTFAKVEAGAGRVSEGSLSVRTRHRLKAILLGGLAVTAIYLTAFAFCHRAILSAAVTVSFVAVTLVLNNAKYAALETPLSPFDHGLLARVVSQPARHLGDVGPLRIGAIAAALVIALAAGLALEPPREVGGALAAYGATAAILGTLVLGAAALALPGARPRLRTAARRLEANRSRWLLPAAAILAGYLAAIREEPPRRAPPARVHGLPDAGTPLAQVLDTAGLVSAQSGSDNSQKTALLAPQPAVAKRLTPADVRRTIWLTRGDLRRRFGDQPHRLAAWFQGPALTRFAALRELASTVPEAHAPAEGARPEMRPVMTHLMQVLRRSSRRLRRRFKTTRPGGEARYIVWYFAQGRVAGMRDGLSEGQHAQLLEPVRPLARLSRTERVRMVLQPGRRWTVAAGPRVTVEDAPHRIQLPDAHPAVFSRIMLYVWLADPAVRRRFDLSRDEDLAAYVGWYVAHAENAFCLEPDLVRPDQRPRMKSPDAPSHGDPQEAPHLAPVETGAARWTDAAPERVAGTPGNGVNLIGYARGEFGIGEDVRMAAKALTAAGVPFSVYAIAPGREVEQRDTSLDALTSEDLPYDTNVFCATGIETVRLVTTQGSKLLGRRRTIGYWPWELPDWPQCWQHAYKVVDELWASSRFTYDAFAKTFPKTLRHMPMAVTVSSSAGCTRADFGLPKDRLLFVFGFDFLSHLPRKNPKACVDAFRRAFPTGQEHVGLVVKAMRVRDGDPTWQEIQDIARHDGRIHIVAQTLDRGRLLDLYRACDVFVSLHRSEGFGRNIAEAMLLGKAAIVTGYSGNMDFTTPETAALVDHRLRTLEPGEYPYGTGMTWAEPDVDHAAWWMSHLAENPAERRRFARRGQELVQAAYNPDRVGAGYAKVLG